jgi:signal transduction histidine kinase
MKLREFQILLIDDDEDDYVNLCGLFSEISGSKYHVTWKSNYNEGLKALQTETFDVCLLDQRLGEHTGMELLKEVKSTGLLCPIIFLTGFGDHELDLQAMQMGASEYLIKDQLSPHLLERTLRYTMKHALDMDELSKSKAQIIQQDRLASLGLLASSLAHEIGTPLGIIRSRAELVARKSKDENVKKDMEVMTTQIDRIVKLVNSLLNLAREKRSDFAAPIDFYPVVQDVLNLIQPEMNKKNIEFIHEIPNDIRVKAEPGPLSQVLLNLLVNSIHAVQNKKDQRKISISVNVSSAKVAITVEDNGSGISEKNLPHLFKPFFTTKDIGQGTGLGLATSLKIVESWNGSIQVKSKEGHGTSFTVTLDKA